MTKKTKKIILGAIVVLIVAVLAWQFLFRSKNSQINLAEIKRGNLSQEVSETGQIKKGDKINLGFKNGGRIREVYVMVGSQVEAGQILAKQDTSELQIQLQEANSNLGVYQAKLDKLTAGASQQDINVAQAEVNSKKIALDGKSQDVQNSYDDALDDLSDAHLKAYNAQNSADYLLRTYFSNKGDQESIIVSDNAKKITAAVLQIKSFVDSAKASGLKDEIDAALFQTKAKLSSISDFLRVLRENCETPNYYSAVSATDKTDIDTQRTNVNTALASITSSQQAISTAKLDADSAQSALQKAQNQLDVIAAPARKEDIDLAKAQADQARAQVQILENKIQDSYLQSPVRGQIIDISKRAGEMYQPAGQDSAMTILPITNFEIEANIYEEDVVKVSIGNAVDVSLIPVPDKVFKGKVVSIYPSEEQIEGVVYYKVIIVFDEAISSIKPGMTADITIKTASKENVLIVPEGAVEKRGDKEFVSVFKNDKKEEREIQTGFVGSDGNVEVLSGIEEGEKVIIP